MLFSEQEHENPFAIETVSKSCNSSFCEEGFWMALAQSSLLEQEYVSQWASSRTFL